MYLFKLSTTGSIDFHNQITKTNNNNSNINNSNYYDLDIHTLSSKRAALRQALKDSKHKAQDWAAAISAIDSYLPHLHALELALARDALVFTSDPEFSWRPTLSSAINPSRIPFHSLSAEIIFSHLSHAQAQSNMALSIIDSLGSYELQPHLSEIERSAMDKRLNNAVKLLSASAGEFSYLAQLNPEPVPGPKSPPDLSKDVLTALSKYVIDQLPLIFYVSR